MFCELLQWVGSHLCGIPCIQTKATANTICQSVELDLKLENGGGSA